MSLGHTGAEYKVVVFAAAHSSCALPVDAICEITHVPATTRVPGQPSTIEGFVNFRGRPVAVVSLVRLLGLPSGQPGLFASLILTRAGAEILGILVDSVAGVSTVAASDLKPLPANHSFNGCSAAQFTSDDHTVTLLDCDRILLDAERQLIADLAGQARKRLQEIEAIGSHGE
jgi:purine-binding chemotaxis protein CheW